MPVGNFLDPSDAEAIIIGGTNATSVTITPNVTFGGTYTFTAPVFAGGNTASGSAANDWSGSTGTFKTSTGVNTIGGATVFPSVAVTATGTSSFDLSGGSGIFKTSTGAVTIGSGAITFSGAPVYASVASTASGTSSFDLSGGSGIFKTSTGAVTIGPGAITISGAPVFAAVAATASGAASFDLSGGSGIFKTSTGVVTIGPGATTLSGTSTHTGLATFNGGVTFGAGAETQVVVGNLESVTAATNMTIDPTKLYHYVTGTTTIVTLVGGTEGCVAILILAAATTLQNATGNTVSALHNQGISGAAPADTVCTGATTTRPFYKKYICTANVPNCSALQWFEMA